jgi:hypothetical protein
MHYVNKNTRGDSFKEKKEKGKNSCPFLGQHE